MKNKFGFAFLLSLFLILFMSLLFMAMFNLLTTDLQITGNQEQDAEALYIAEAGIEDAIYNLRVNKNWTSDGLTPVEFPAGSGNNYAVTKLADSDIITSVGTLSGEFSKTIETKVSVSVEGPPYDIKVMSWEEK